MAGRNLHVVDEEIVGIRKRRGKTRSEFWCEGLESAKKLAGGQEKCKAVEKRKPGDSLGGGFKNAERVMGWPAQATRR